MEVTGCRCPRNSCPEYFSNSQNNYLVEPLFSKVEDLTSVTFMRMHFIVGIFLRMLQNLLNKDFQGGQCNIRPLVIMVSKRDMKIPFDVLVIFLIFFHYKEVIQFSQFCPFQRGLLRPNFNSVYDRVVLYISKNCLVVNLIYY